MFRRQNLKESQVVSHKILKNSFWGKIDSSSCFSTPVDTESVKCEVVLEKQKVMVLRSLESWCISLFSNDAYLSYAWNTKKEFLILIIKCLIQMPIIFTKEKNQDFERWWTSALPVATTRIFGKSNGRNQGQNNRCRPRSFQSETWTGHSQHQRRQLCKKQTLKDSSVWLEMLSEDVDWLNRFAQRYNQSFTSNEKGLHRLVQIKFISNLFVQMCEK